MATAGTTYIKVTATHIRVPGPLLVPEGREVQNPAAPGEVMGLLNHVLRRRSRISRRKGVHNGQRGQEKIEWNRPARFLGPGSPATRTATLRRRERGVFDFMPPKQNGVPKREDLGMCHAITVIVPANQPETRRWK